MRRGAGISRLSRQTANLSNYTALSTTLSTQQLATLESSLDSFRAALVHFAAQHRADIRKYPAFRHQFQKTCGIGEIDMVDRTECSAELALQIVDVGVSTRERNGGIIEMSELIARVERMRSGGKEGKEGGEKITPDDIHRALELLHPLEAGYSVHSGGGAGGDRDHVHSMLLVLASEAGGHLTESTVMDKTGWVGLRACTALDDCVMRQGLGWRDEDGSVWVVAAAEFED